MGRIYDYKVNYSKYLELRKERREQQQKAYDEQQKFITEKALYDTGVMPEYGAQLLTLSTCGDTRPDTDARFALLAVRID